MLITLSIIQSLIGLQIPQDEYIIKFYYYSDRIWCEINNEETNETLFEGQVTNYEELKKFTCEFDILNNFDLGRTIGLITLRIMKSESINPKNIF